MKWISGLKPRFENQVQTWKWKTWKWEAEFQVYFKKSDVYYFSRFLVVNVDKRRVFGSMSPHGEEGDSKQMSQSRKHDILRGFIRNVVGPIFPDIYVPNPYSVDPNTGGM